MNGASEPNSSATQRALPALAGGEPLAPRPVSLPVLRLPGARPVRPGPHPGVGRSGRLPSILLLAGLLLVVCGSVACSDLERAAYRTLAVTKAEYEAVQRGVAEAAVHGLITPEQWNRFAVAGHRFIDMHNTAVDAFALWRQSQSSDDAERLLALLEILPRLVREINALAASFAETEPATPRQEGSKLSLGVFVPLW